MAKMLRLFLLIVAVAASGQEAVTTTTTTTAPPLAARDFDSSDTREQLREVLRRLPPEVGKVLKLDPTLWSNQQFLNNYAPLAEFVASHPEVARNTDFYLESVWIPRDVVPDAASVRVWRDLMEGLFILMVVGINLGAFMWLIKTIVEHRRWGRLSRVQSEVHNKILDRFGSNEDVLAYLNSTAGRKFLEAAPIPLTPSGAFTPNPPISRILWSVQAGLVLGAAGVGLKLMAWSADKDVSPALSGLGIFAIAIGGGFVAAAIVSLFLSRRLGLWQSPTATASAEAHSE